MFIIIFLFSPSLPSFLIMTDQPRRVKIVKAAPAHPKYAGKWDRYLNKFLRKGECCVCKNLHLVVMRLPCNHALCIEDLQGYLESALGDISMFPVKCPMHYQGCAGTIEAKIAKRVLNEVQYNRFTEFCDRAMYGDGECCLIFTSPLLCSSPTFSCNYASSIKAMQVRS